MPLRIIILANNYPSNLRPMDGIFIHTQCVALSKNGVSVKVVAPIPWTPSIISGFNERWKRYYLLPDNYVFNGIPVMRPRYFAVPRENYWAFPHLFYASVAEQVREYRPDLIHAHMGYPAGLAGVTVGKRWGIPSVITLHGSDINTDPQNSSLYRFYIKIALKQATEVISVSNALAEKAFKLGGRPAKVLPIGIDLKKYSKLPGKTEARIKLNLPKDKKIILYVGNLLPSKGLFEIKNLMESLDVQNVLLVVVGDGKLRDLAKGIKNVVYVGMVPNDVIPFYMIASDVFILPSHTEGMPTVLIEAGAANLPVVASTVGGIPELLGEGRGWLVAPKSVQALKDAVLSVLSCPEEAIKRSAQLNKYVFAEYDANINCKKLINIYMRAIQGIKF